MLEWALAPLVSHPFCVLSSSHFNLERLERLPTFELANHVSQSRIGTLVCCARGV